MGSGASESGDDMVVGRTNTSEERTILVATNGENAPGGYGEDFVLSVSITDDKVLRTVPEGVDGIHATGTVEWVSGGAIGTVAPGNGVVARGANGLVGYVHGAPRNKGEEDAVRAGVLGAGGAGAVGVFGRGANGVVGYADATARDTAWEAADPTGVAGRGEVGVRGVGENGPGVEGRSDLNPGVQGISVNGPGVAGRSNDGFGVFAESGTGPGLAASSAEDRGAMLQSRRMAQLWLVPQRVDRMLPPSTYTPTAIPIVEQRQTGPALPKDGRPGDLIAVEDPDDVCTLWFCVANPGPARWAQVLLGQPFNGRA